MFCQSLEVTLHLVFTRAKEHNHQTITVEHLLLSLLDNVDAVEVLKLCNTDIERLKKQIIQYLSNHCDNCDDNHNTQTKPSLGFQRVLQRALFQVQASGKSEVTGANVLLALYSEYGSHAVRFLTQEGVTRLDILGVIGNQFDAMDGFQPQDTSLFQDNMSEESLMEPVLEESSIEKYAVNLNQRAKDGKIDNIIGRQEELTRITQILCRKKKNNPMLLGEPGVGKTALAEELSLRIVSGNVPKPLLGSTVYSLDIALLLAGTKYRGDFEKRFKNVLAKLKKMNKVILFIDEIHTIIGAGSASGGNLDAANMLKPILTTGEIRCVGATTYKEYRNVFSKDDALSRRFLPVDIEEPTKDQALKIARGLKDNYEKYHNVRYTDAAIFRSVELCDKYLCDRKMPDKLIDIIDESATVLLFGRQPNRSVVGINDVEKIVASMCHLPLEQIQSDRRRKKDCSDIYTDLSTRIFGQDEVVRTVTDMIELNRAGLSRDAGPVASFLFNGPTGVGKTELCNVLSQSLGLKLLRFDMSEYLEQHSISRLIGSPPGYVGYEQNGQLTESVKNHPYSLVLFDEIEKSDPAIRNILLQIMDYGFLTDSMSRKIDFRNTVIVMTSNVGARSAEKNTIGFSNECPVKSMTDISIQKAFSPEFRNRLDAVLTFNKLAGVVVKQIAQKFLDEVIHKLKRRNIELSISKAAMVWICNHGYDEKLGARPMQRVIQRSISQPVAKIILDDRLKGNRRITVSVSGDQLVLR